MGRVISYSEKTGYNDGDYLLLDNGDGGTKRIRADRVGIQLDLTLTDPNKAAPADTVKKVEDFAKAGLSIVKVNLKSLMTDHDKVYLYTGVEPNESTGYWYYWNGTDFVPGGLYGAWVQIDAVPTQGSTNAVSSGSVYAVTNALREEVTYFSGKGIVDWVSGGYIVTSGDTVDITSVTASTSYSYAVINCAEGDVFVLTATGALGARPWCFINSDGVPLSRATTSQLESVALRIVAPQSAVKLVVNSNITRNPNTVCYIGESETIDINNIRAENEVILNCKPLQFVKGYYFATSGSTVDISKATLSANWSYVKDENCKAGDTYNIIGSGGSSGRLWCFIDTNGNVLESSESNKAAESFITVTAPQDASVFIVNHKHGDFDGYVIKGNLSASSVREITLKDIPLQFGVLSANGTVSESRAFLITKDYIYGFAKDIKVLADDIKVAIGVWNGTSFSRQYWLTSGTEYTPLSSDKKYKIYVAKSDESRIIDIDAIASSVQITVDSKLYEDYCAKKENETNNIITGYTDRLKLLMADNYRIEYANASNPLNLKSVYGNNQNVHPKVLYISGGFVGYKYWMAYTPYPWGNAVYENPCIACSNDGYEWINIANNPIDVPDSNITGYYSDTHLVYRADTQKLECWYRLADTGNMVETIYRKISSDGVTWGEREALYTYSGATSLTRVLSPVAFWDGAKYKIWIVFYTSGTNPSENNQYIKYFESTDGTNWTFVRDIKIRFTRDNIVYRIWHIDLIYENNTYVLLAMCKGGSSSDETANNKIWDLFIVTSADNITYSSPSPVMLGNSDGWDKYLYRSTIVKVNDKYIIYYSALNHLDAHYIGVSTSKTLGDFIGDF